MNRPTHSKSGLFLMEIMFNILFFSVLITFCLQLFFEAHSLSESTTVLHRAVSTCSSLAEIYQSSPNGEDSLQQYYPDSVVSDNSLQIYFSEDFINCSQKGAAFSAEFTFSEDNPKTATLCFLRLSDSETLYSLNISGYCPQTVTALTGGERP